MTTLDVGPACSPEASFSGQERDELQNSALAGGLEEYAPEQIDSPLTLFVYHRSFTDISQIDSPQYRDLFQQGPNNLSNFHPGVTDQPRFSQYCPSSEDLWLSLLQPMIAANWQSSGDGAPKAPLVCFNPVSAAPSARSHLGSKFLSGILAVSAYLLLGSFEKLLATNGQSRRGFVCEMDYKTLPKALTPPLQEDIYMHEFIERVRLATLVRKQLPGEPSLSDFVMDNTPNVLTAEVKGFIGLLWGSGARHEFLAVCRIVCLCLRDEFTPATIKTNAARMP